MHILHVLGKDFQLLALKDTSFLQCKYFSTFTFRKVAMPLHFIRSNGSQYDDVIMRSVSKKCTFFDLNQVEMP